MVLLLTCLYGHPIYHGQLMPDGPIFWMSCVTSPFLCGQSSMIYAFSFYRCASLGVISCISCIDIHTGRSMAVSIALIFMLRPCIYLSLLSSWLFHDSQSGMNSSGPGLYNIHTLYLFMCRIMCCRHFDYHIFSHYCYQ